MIEQRNQRIETLQPLFDICEVVSMQYHVSYK